MKNIEEFVVKSVHGENVKGPIKWMIVILGPNHHAKDIKKLLASEGHKNLNIIVVLITNNINTLDDSHHHDNESHEHHLSEIHNLDQTE